MLFNGRHLTDEEVVSKLHSLQTMGRITDGVQVIILGTLGQYLYTSGALAVDAPHWIQFRDFMGGQHNVGLSVMLIALVGLSGIFTLAWTKTDTTYTWLMWVFSVAAMLWCWTVAGFNTHALVAEHIGNSGLWAWGLSGLFFLFSRIAITIASGLGSSTPEEHAHDQA